MIRCKCRVLCERIVLITFSSSWHLLLTCLVSWPPDIRGKIVSHWLRNVMSFILDVKWFTKIKVGPPYLLCSMCEASRRVGEWFAPNAVPVVWREPKDHSSGCYCFWTDVKEITSNSRLSVKYPHLPLQWGLSHTVKSCFYRSLCKVWILAMTALILITDSKKCWLLSDIRSILFLIWTVFINARRY